MKVAKEGEDDKSTKKVVTEVVNNSDPMCREVVEDKPDLCLRCALGFYLKEGDKECVPNCLSLSVTYSETFTCSSCKAGYSMTQGRDFIMFYMLFREYKGF